MKDVLACLCLLGSMEAATAAERTVMLSLPTMDCPVCPITIKKALSKVTGVVHADVRFENRQATVTFDDAKTDPEALMRATRDAGYPSTLVVKK